MRKFFCIILFFGAGAAVFSQNTDINILKSVNVHRNRSLDGAMKTITDSYFPVAAGIPSVMVAGGLIAHNKKLIYNGLELTAGGIINLLLTKTIKAVANRDRPAQTYSFIEPYEDLHGYSFPSGHTSIAFSLAAAISLEYKKWYVVVPAFTWASLVGYSRLHLGVHYPSDVLGGILVGSGSAWLCHVLRKKIEHRKKIKKNR